MTKATIGIISMFAFALTSTSFSAALAEKLTSEDLIEATRISIAELSRTDPEHAEHLSGFKTWLSGSSVKLKLYIAHDTSTMELNYTCIKSSAVLRCNRLN